MTQCLDDDRCRDKHVGAQTPLDGRSNPVLREGMRSLVVAVVVLTWIGAARAACIGCNERPVPYPDRLVRKIVTKLASDDFAGRDNDTPGSAEAQDLLVKRLRRAGRGVDPSKPKLEAFKQHFTFNGVTGTNLLAVVRGRELPDEYVIVGAHYDHLDTRSDDSGRCRSGGTPGGAICNGATDNATGAATVIAIGRAFKKHPPRRSVVLALWDAEEDGLTGSLYYVNNPLVPLAKTVSYVNFDIMGSNLLPHLATTSFAVGPETGTGLTDVVLAAIEAEQFGTLPISYIFGQLRSDYASFVAVNVPTVFFSDSTNGCYHTTADDLDVVDWAKVGKEGRIALRVTSALAETTTPPAFVPPNPSLATFADALTLQEVFVRAQPDVTLFSSADQTVLLGIRDSLAQVVAGGPNAFGQDDIGLVLQTALDGIAAIQRLGCRKP
jgi:hypothetical protein